MKTLELKQQILEAMKVLVSDGQTIASRNNGDFSEFANENNFPLDLVEEVFLENEYYLTQLYQKSYRS